MIMIITIWMTSCKLITHSNNKHKVLDKVKNISINNSKIMEDKCNGNHKTMNKKTTSVEATPVHKHSNNSVSNQLNSKYLCMEPHKLMEMILTMKKEKE